MNKITKNLTKDSFTYGFSSVLQQGLSFLLIPLYTNYLSAGEYGIVVLTTSISLLLNIFFGMSLRGIVAKRYYDYKNDKNKLDIFLSSMFIFALIFGFALASILSTQIGKSLFDILIPGINFEKYIVLSIWYSYFLSIIQIFQDLLRSQQKVKSFVILQFGTFLSTTALIMYFVIFRNLGALGQILGIFSSSFLTFIIIILVIIKNHGIHFSIKFIKEGLSFGLPLVIHLLSGWAVSRIDRILIGRFEGSDQVGIYDLGYKIGMSIYLITSAINFAWTPIFYENAKNSSREIFSKIFNAYFVIISFIVLNISFFSKEIISLISPEQYLQAYKIVPIVSISYFIQGIYYMRVTPIFYKEKTKKLAYSSLFSGVINIILNLILINRIGIYGSAFSLLISQAIQLIVVHLISQKIYKISFEKAKLSVFFVQFILLIFIFSIISFSNQYVEFCLKIIVSLFSFLFSIKIGLIERADLLSIKNMFRKKNI